MKTIYLSNTSNNFTQNQQFGPSQQSNNYYKPSIQTGANSSINGNNNSNITNQSNFGYILYLLLTRI